MLWLLLFYSTLTIEHVKWCIDCHTVITVAVWDKKNQRSNHDDEHEDGCNSQNSEHVWDNGWWTFLGLTEQMLWEMTHRKHSELYDWHVLNTFITAAAVTTFIFHFTKHT